MKTNLAYVTLLFFTIAIAGYLMANFLENENSEMIYQWGVALFNLSGMLLLLLTSSIYKTIFGKFIIACLIFLVLPRFHLGNQGVSFAMFFVGLTGISFFYTIHFLQKRSKDIIDYLKVILVFVYAFVYVIGSVLKVLHWTGADELRLTGQVLLILSVGYTVIKELRAPAPVETQTDILDHPNN